MTSVLMGNIWIVVLPLAAFGCFTNIVAYCYAIYSDGGVTGGGVYHNIDGDAHHSEPLLSSEENWQYHSDHGDVP